MFFILEIFISLENKTTQYLKLIVDATEVDEEEDPSFLETPGVD